MTTSEYIELLDWTTRSIVPGKPGSTPEAAPPIFERLGLDLSGQSWCELVSNFGRLFSLVAVRPQVVDVHRGPQRGKHFHLTNQARQLMSA